MLKYVYNVIHADIYTTKLHAPIYDIKKCSFMNKHLVEWGLFVIVLDVQMSCKYCRKLGHDEHAAMPSFWFVGTFLLKHSYPDREQNFRIQLRMQFLVLTKS